MKIGGSSPLPQKQMPCPILAQVTYWQPYCLDQSHPTWTAVFLWDFPKKCTHFLSVPSVSVPSCGNFLSLTILTVLWKYSSLISPDIIRGCHLNSIPLVFYPKSDSMIFAATRNYSQVKALQFYYKKDFVFQPNFVVCLLKWEDVNKIH